MILTFFIAMAFITTLFIVVYMLFVHEYDNFPVVGYWVSAGWQTISFLVAVPHGPNSIRGEYYLFNFTEHELIVAAIGLTIGLLTSIVVFFDLGWYESIIDTNDKIGRRWRRTFPPKKLKVEIKPSTELGDKPTIHSSGVKSLK